MPRSDFVFAEGENVGVGAPTDNDFVYVEDELLNDTGDSSFVFVEGRGIGISPALTEGELCLPDRIIAVGETVDMRWDVQNNTDEPTRYTTEWREDGSEFSSQTATIQPDKIIAFSESRTKNSAGSYRYQANGSRKPTVAWMNLRVEDWTASPYYPEIQTESELELTLQGAANGDVSVDVEFVEYDKNATLTDSGTVVDTASGTVPSSGSASFATQVLKEEIAKEYSAHVTESGSGVTGITRRLRVTWADEIVPVEVGMVANSFEDPDESDDSDAPTSIAYCTDDDPTYHYALADGILSLDGSKNIDARAWSTTEYRFIIDAAERIYVDWDSTTLTSEYYDGGPTTESSVDCTLGGVEPSYAEEAIGTGIEYVNPNFSQRVDSYDVSDQRGFFYLGIGCESSTNQKDEVEMNAYDAWAEDEFGNKIYDFILPHERV